MRLTHSELLDRYRDGRLCLALIGMCNAGKSALARVLARERGFRSLSVDDELARAYPASGRLDRRETAVPSPRARQERNLEREAACLTALALPPRGNMVLDTTGSLAHLPDAAARALRERFLTVYLEIPVDAEAAVLESLLAAPKDLYWGGFYRRRRGEPAAAAVRRCFPALYGWRKLRYERLADVTVPAPLDGEPQSETLWALMVDGLERHPPDLAEEGTDGFRA